MECVEEKSPHHEEEEVFHDPEEATLFVPLREQSSPQDQVYQSLLDLTDLTPIQHQREVPTPPPTGSRVVETPPRNYVEGFANTTLTMAALKGSRRIYVQDQTGFRIGRIILIHDLFAAQIVAYGSIVLDRPVDRDYPVGSTVRELTPLDDHRVDSQGRTFINGVAMDPGDHGSNTLSLQEDNFLLFQKTGC